MSKILGLDLGTNSIGWAIVDREGTHFTLIAKGVRIFSEGVKSEKGVESSKSAERTNYRSARKIKFRRKLRKYETLKVLSKNGMCPLSIEEVEEWRKSNFKKYPLNPDFLKWLRTDDDQNNNPYTYRDRASKQKVSLYELGRALYHITQRRGFLSNRLDQSADGIIEQHAPNIESRIEDSQTIYELLFEVRDYFDGLAILDKSSKDLDEGEKKLKALFNAFEKIIKTNDFENAKAELLIRLNRKEDWGVVKQQIGAISQSMKTDGFVTLGQYFNSLYNKEKIRNQYTAREEHYLSELEIICKTQAIAGINENEKLPEKRYFGLVKALYRAIFFQRPIKSEKGSIGKKCSLEKNKMRCAVSHPDYEEHRMWQYLNTIKIKTPTDETLRFLTLKEKEKLVPKFLRKREHFNFEDLAKELILKEASFEFYRSSNAKEADYLFNYRPKETVLGCVVSASLKKVFGNDWHTRHWTYKIKNAVGKTVIRNVDYKDIWHLLSVSTSDIYLEEYAKEKLDLDEKHAKLFSKIRLKKDFASLSLNAITKMLPYLRQGLLYSHAVFMANIENVVDRYIWNNPKERLFIQDKIAEIIENNTFENNKLELVNGLIKNYKINNCHYSRESEATYKEDLRKKVITVFSDNRNQEAIVRELFPVFMEQWKQNKYIIIRRLDEKVIAFLKDKNKNGQAYCSNKSKLGKLYRPSDTEVFKKKKIKDKSGNEKIVLGSPLLSSIKNPMAMRALHQLRKVLNTLILEGSIDEKTKVHIELAGELNDANKRKAIQDFQNENKKKKDDFRKEIKDLYFAECKKEIELTEEDVLRYQLWIEQDKIDIYEEGQTINICDIMGKNPKYDIEHTIPRSISQDNSMMNKTLCSQQFNREIKKNKMPIALANYQQILFRIEHWRKEVDRLTWEIEQILKSTKTTVTKEAKDRKIRRRHYLTLKRNYLRGKYERFIWTTPKPRFRNNPIPSRNIITKYSIAYLNSYFDSVENVKRGMVAEFRKVWGIQESYYREDRKYYIERDTSKHTYHTIDAITIACMTRDKYDVLSHAWRLEDEGRFIEAQKVLDESKPWKTFKEDLVRIEEEILVSHHTPDNVKKTSKKIIRVRGKKQYVAEIEKDIAGRTIVKKDNGKIIYKVDDKGRYIPRLQQGDTVRGSLHQDSIYGAIILPEIDKHTNKPKHSPEGDFIIEKDSKGNNKINFVIRKTVSKLSEKDIKNIVDPVVLQKIQKAVDEETITFKTIQGKKRATLKEGATIWMREPNKEKNLVGIPINKVRVFTGLKNPLKIKQHAIVSKSRHEHKQKVYGQNEENYAMAIYEGIDKRGNVKRNFESVNYLDAGNYYKWSSKNNNENLLVPLIHLKSQLPLKYEVKKGDLVLFYKEIKEELNEIKNEDLTKRLYKIIGFESDGRIQFRHHKTAMKQNSSNKKELTIVRLMADNNLRNSQVNFDYPVPWLRLSISNCNFLLNDKEFKINPLGRITIL